MNKVKTHVYLDLEATGLKNSGRPRITEISLVAISSEEIMKLNSKIVKLGPSKKIENYSFQTEGLIPWVINKITLCVYPMATIMPQVSDITGLDNYNLSDQARFDANTGDLLNSFLTRLPAPVCLVAHNGNVYDFPLLKAEMKKAGVQLISELLCADSLTGIKTILKKKQETRRDSVSMACSRIIEPKSYSLINLHQHIFNCVPAISHGAEADCLALLRITAAFGQEWLDWVEKNCIAFSDCQNMWWWG